MHSTTTRWSTCEQTGTPFFVSPLNLRFVASRRRVESAPKSVHVDSAAPAFHRTYSPMMIRTEIDELTTTHRSVVSVMM
eukprot:3869535-Prymnesium_polylepis.1